MGFVAKASFNLSSDARQEPIEKSKRREYCILESQATSEDAFTDPWILCKEDGVFVHVCVGEEDDLGLVFGLELSHLTEL